MTGLKCSRPALRALFIALLLVPAAASSLDAGVLERALVASMDYPTLAGEITSRGSLFGRPAVDVARAVAADARFDTHEKDALYLLLLRSSDPVSGEREDLARFVVGRHGEIRDGSLIELALEWDGASVSPLGLVTLLADVRNRYTVLAGSDRLLEALAGIAVRLSDGDDGPAMRWRTVAFSLLVELGRGARTRDAVQAADGAAAILAERMRNQN